MSGLRSEAMYKRLLMKDNITLKRAVKIAIGMKAAQKDAGTFQGSTEQQVIHLVKLHQMCKHYGRTNHSVDG